ncbi:DUF4097 domain-containing protein [Oceanobacillus iheyensis]|uniref:DUF4097 domain-containing protein n=1 Tax=Oceanobacillus iheyensis (strain DSM 14371 / CIP 107618 / JCM 11309 / KCTC 3954 / HTE831) TaxID=221109 RepID=Q8ESW4_OCEIH|nr:DUF4097 family beta strand repeat-containing protein [Oceanobacillus iheyensis]BAC12458.1 hypothetical protein [Oceanobacillus iheyensis HTE831]
MLFFKSSKQIKEQKKLMNNHIETIIIQSGWADVNIYTHKENYISLFLTSIENGPYWIVEENQDQLRLTIEPGIRRLHFRFNQTIKLDVYVPEQNNINWEVEADSGSVYFYKQVVQNIMLRVGSGNFKGNDLTVNNAFVEVGTGEVNINHFNGENLQLVGGSGDIKLVDVTCNRIMSKIGSGSLRYNHVRYKEMISEGGSGDVFLENFQGDTKMKVGSGDIEVVLDERPNLKCELQAGSGTIITDTGHISDGKIHKDYGEAKYVLALTSRSGDVVVKQKF